VSAVSTTQPYPANSLAGGLGRLGLGWAGLAAQGGRAKLAGQLGGAKKKAKDKSTSALGTVQIFKLFLTF